MDTRDIPPQPVYLVDDEPEIVFSAGLWLRRAGIGPIATILDAREVMTRMEAAPPAVVVLDLLMPNGSGVELLPRLLERFPETPIVIMTANNEVDTAVSCMKNGAYDYLLKPVDPQRFVACVENALENRRLKSEIHALKERLLSGVLKRPELFAALVTVSRGMHAVFQYLEAVAPSGQPVLITGETGVGKELAARALHQASGKGPFVAENVAGLDDHVFADTLFGHRRGAFTGADRERAGLVAQAAGGTLFLDEIGDLSANAQIKLLRLLQENLYYPLGADEPVVSRARVVLATHRDLREDVARGRFRQDLYYRLATHQVRIPPLRERAEDIPVLLRYYLDEASRQLAKPAPELPHPLPSPLLTHPFPGNVRELRAMAFDLMARYSGGPFTSSQLLSALGELAPVPGPVAAPGKSNTLFPDMREAVRRLEEKLIARAMQQSNGNQSAAASLLGITRQALNKRLRLIPPRGGDPESAAPEERRNKTS